MRESGECSAHGIYVGSYCPHCLAEQSGERAPRPERDLFDETPDYAVIISRIVFPHRPPPEMRAYGWVAQ
jgi:hypothetical protein